MNTVHVSFTYECNSIGDHVLACFFLGTASGSVGFPRDGFGMFLESWRPSTTMDLLIMKTMTSVKRWQIAMLRTKSTAQLDPSVIFIVYHENFVGL